MLLDAVQKWHDGCVFYKCPHVEPIEELDVGVSRGMHYSIHYVPVCRVVNMDHKRCVVRRLLALSARRTRLVLTNGELNCLFLERQNPRVSLLLVVGAELCKAPIRKSLKAQGFSHRVQGVPSFKVVAPLLVDTSRTDWYHNGQVSVYVITYLMYLYARNNDCKLMLQQSKGH